MTLDLVVIGETDNTNVEGLHHPLESWRVEVMDPLGLILLLL